MHQLDRSSVTPPSCLANFNYQTQVWADLSQGCKAQVREALVQMQGIPAIGTTLAPKYGVRCAYCEGVIYHAEHIEHFRRKHPQHFPELTFEWTNLFLACGSKDHCGHFKDRPSAPSYDADQIIKPDECDPERYLYFHSSGEVRVREGLQQNDTHRAAETIRALGLNNSALAGSRAKALRTYRKKIVDDLDEIASWEPAVRHAYLCEEIKAIRFDPYSTTIKHFLQATT